MSIVIITLGILSCDKDENNEVNNQSKELSYDQEMEQKLTGTSWRMTKFTEYDENTGQIQYRSIEPGIVTFAANNVIHYINITSIWNRTATSTWKMEDGLLCCSGIGQDIYTGKHITGAVMQFIDFYNYIDELNNSEMILRSRTDYRPSTRYFTKIPYTGIGSDGGNNEGGSNKGEPPYVTDFSYTATKTSITVKFMATERPTSATIRYGSSSATSKISESIINKQISATASGLKAGTKYFFKCTVTNAYGSTTSAEYPAYTNY